MKTIGRILIIVAAFALMMGIIYSAVNAGGSTTTAPVFQRGGDGFAPNGERHDFRGEGRGGGVGGMLFGFLKNTIIVAFVVAIIAYPKNLIQQRRRAVQVRTN